MTRKRIFLKWNIFFLIRVQEIEIDQNRESSIESKASWTLLITWGMLSANQHRAFHYSPTQWEKIKNEEFDFFLILKEKI